MYEVLFESSIKDDAGIKFLDSDNSKQLEVIKNILKVMHDRIRSRNEDVIQTIDVLEYYVKILIDIPNISVLKYALTLMNELLKGDFIIKGERPFKSFYWVVFYLSNGFKNLEQLLVEFWLPLEIQHQGKRMKSNLNINSTLSYKIKGVALDQNVYDQSSDRHDSKNNASRGSKLYPEIETKDIELDWEFYDLINNVLEYTNVVLNDLEIFATPEIYSSILRSYHRALPDRATDKLLNSIYKITIDKNHRISNGRYNAMYSKDFIRTFSNMFCLYCLNITSEDNQTQSKYFNLMLKLIYHNILLVNDKTLCSVNMSTDFDASKDMTSFFQMNRATGVVKDRTSNKNIKTIILQNPSIFDDLMLWFVKLGQSSESLGEDVYKERMIQIIFLFVYMLISCKDQIELDPVEIIIQSKDYLFKNSHTIKYGMLLFMLLFSDKYNKSSFDFKKLLINSKEGVKSLVLKLNESQTDEQLMMNMYLVWLVCLETSKELKVKVISEINLLRLFDKMHVNTLSYENQKTLISYILEMWCLSNEMLYFPVQDQIFVKQMFDLKEMRYVKDTIDNVFMNLSEFLPKDDEDDIFYTENDFLSASQANFWAYVEDEIEQTIREAFAFIESDFLNCMFLILFQLDKKLQWEFLNSLIPLIEQRSECRRVISKMEVLEFFLRIYQYHRDNMDENSDSLEIDREYLRLLLKLISFSLQNGIPIEDDTYLYSLIKGGRNHQVDESLLLMLCFQVEYSDIPNNVNFKETQDSFGLAAFISKGKSLQQVEKEVCLSPFVTNLPNRKKGYWILFWFRLKKLYDNMNIISIVDYKGEKILKISLNVLREFENVNIQDRIGTSNYLSTNDIDSVKIK